MTRNEVIFQRLEEMKETANGINLNIPDIKKKYLQLSNLYEEMALLASGRCFFSRGAYELKRLEGCYRHLEDKFKKLSEA